MCYAFFNMSFYLDEQTYSKREEYHSETLILTCGLYNLRVIPKPYSKVFHNSDRPVNIFVFIVII